MKSSTVNYRVPSGNKFVWPVHEVRTVVFREEDAGSLELGQVVGMFVDGAPTGQYMAVDSWTGPYHTIPYGVISNRPLEGPFRTIEESVKDWQQRGIAFTRQTVVRAISFYRRS